MDSIQLAACLEANPHNLRGYATAPLCPHDLAAARFEAEGRAAFPHGRNPHNVGTMANERWAAGWHMADNAINGEA